MKKIAAVLCALLSMPIAAHAKNPFVAYAPEATAFVECAPEACDALWLKVQPWIARNAPFRISVATDLVVQTFGPLESMADAFAYTVTREPGRITITAHCARVLWGRCAYDPAPAANLLWAELRKESP